MKRVRRRKAGRKLARIGAPDASLTATSGVAAVAEFVDQLDVVGTFDRGIGSIKQRARGVTAGELLVGLAQSQLLGGDALVALDRQRQDVAAVELSAVPGIPATTAGSLARRFTAAHFAGVEAANAAVISRAHRLLRAERRVKLAGSVTIDMDSTDVEVYGSARKAWPTTTPDNVPADRTWRPGPRRG